MKALSATINTTMFRAALCGAAMLLGLQGLGAAAPSHASSLRAVAAATTTNPSGLYYKIINRNSSKLLNVRGASSQDGAPVIQYYDYHPSPNVTTDNSLWAFEPGSNGCFKIVNKNSGKLLTIPNTPNVSTTGAIQLLQLPDSNSLAAEWKLTPATDGSNYYTIASCFDNMVVDVSGASTNDDTLVEQNNPSGATSQEWQIQAYFAPTVNYSYKIKNVNSGLLLNVNNGSKTAGAVIDQWYDDDGTDSQWQFAPVSGTPCFTITNVNSSMMLNIPGGSKQPSTELIQWTPNSADQNSQWMPIPSGIGTAIVSCYDHLVVDVSSANKAAGAFIDQYTNIGTPGQLWILEPVSRVNDSASAVTYSGNWVYSTNRGLGDYQNDVHSTTENGDYFTYTFTGTGISFITEKNSDEGNVDIYIDGVFRQKVDCANSTRVTQQAVYTASNLTPGQHTLKVVKDDGTWMLLDALDVTG
jgi:hypothetical protein